MAKKSPMQIMNDLGSMAHNKAQPPNDGDEDDIPAKASKKGPKQAAAAINEKKKGNAPSPKVPKPSGY